MQQLPASLCCSFKGRPVLPIDHEPTQATVLLQRFDERFVDMLPCNNNEQRTSYTESLLLPAHSTKSVYATLLDICVLHTASLRAARSTLSDQDVGKPAHHVFTDVRAWAVHPRMS
jgi:hypothetical protein